MPESELQVVKAAAFRICDVLMAQLCEGYRPREYSPGPGLKHGAKSRLVAVRRALVYATDLSWVSSVYEILQQQLNEGCYALIQQIQQQKPVPYPPHPSPIIYPTGLPPAQREAGEQFSLEGADQVEDPLRVRSTRAPRVAHRRYVLDLTSETLEYWRQIYDLTAAEAAVWCNVSRARWREWESGACAVGLSEAARIYGSLGVRTSVLDLVAYDLVDRLHDSLVSSQRYFAEQPITFEHDIWFLVAQQIGVDGEAVIRLTPLAGAALGSAVRTVYRWAERWWLQDEGFEWQGPYECDCARLVGHPLVRDALSQGWEIKGPGGRELRRHAERWQQAVVRVEEERVEALRAQRYGGVVCRFVAPAGVVPDGCSAPSREAEPVGGAEQTSADA